MLSNPWNASRPDGNSFKVSTGCLLAMALVGFLIGSAVPMGILMGPMMCGLYLAFFKRRRGEPIEFGTLFKGFDYFGNSVVAAMLHAIPIVAVVIPAYFLFYIGMFVSIAAWVMSLKPAGVFGVLFSLRSSSSLSFGGHCHLTIGFTFSYPLIVDRRMQGFEAVKLSFKAAMANFWRLLHGDACGAVEYSRRDAVLRRSVSYVSDHVRGRRCGLRTSFGLADPNEAGVKSATATTDGLIELAFDSGSHHSRTKGCVT